MKKYFLPLFILVVLFFTANAYATVTATVDRNPVSIGETLRLIITDDNFQGAATRPTLSQLPASLEIVSTEQSHQITYINGKVSKRMQWIYTLMVTQKGQFTIPAINIGNVLTNPIKITVNSDPDHPVTAINQRDKGFFMTVNVEPASVYIQGELLYTLRIYYSSSIANGQLMPPQMDDGAVKQIGQDKIYQTTLNNHYYQVFQRQFMITPNHSGTITIKPATFHGQIAIRDPNNPYNDFMNPRVKSLFVKAPLKSVIVKPMPGEFKDGWWFPADQVTLQEQWSNTNGEAHIGEPITRTIILRAIGASSDRLPKIPEFAIVGINQYPDKPVLNTELQGTRLQGTRTLKIVYIPEQSGNMTIPAIEIPWWNNQTGAKEIASLPARTLMVLPAAGKADDKNAVGNAGETSSATLTKDSVNAVKPVKNVLSRNVNFWEWIAIGFIALWLLTLGIWFYLARGRRSHVGIERMNETIITPRAALSAIQKASDANDPHATRSAILQWARVSWPDKKIHTLADVVACVKSPQVSGLFDALDAALYQRDKGPWDGKLFWDQFKACINNKKMNAKKSDDLSLPPLNF